jgi:hypothetical protein
MLKIRSFDDYFVTEIAEMGDLSVKTVIRHPEVLSQAIK